MHSVTDPRYPANKMWWSAWKKRQSQPGSDVKWTDTPIRPSIEDDKGSWAATNTWRGMVL